ncbi:hypothetical protein FGB62_164g06 [Gracilaria domingensis]|nr:hypothetical protein FGB62_164g06 [Gracilaria domingensis]
MSMTELRFKTTFIVLLALTLVRDAYGWGPGRCKKNGRSVARCCEYEAYRCHSGAGRAPSHCDFCQEICILLSTEKVCVSGGTGLLGSKKCYPGVHWSKVCAAIANDASLTGSAFDHVDRELSTAPTEQLRGKRVEKFPLDMAALERSIGISASFTKKVAKLDGVNRQNRNAVTSQIAFLIELMGEVLSALRSASISNSADLVRTNMNRAVSSLQQLIIQARALVNLVPNTDRPLFRTVFDQWISVLRVIRVTLRDFVDENATIDDLKISVNTIVTELRQGFWTRASVALNAYAAFGQFSRDWPPWINAIGQYLGGN